MFCKFSSQYAMSTSTLVDNVFLQEFMPSENGDYVKVYLYGLYFCSARPDATIEEFAKDLNLTEEDIANCMYYWQEKGLVQVLSEQPFQVKYMPIKSVIENARKYNKDEFVNFNIAAQELIGGRMISVNEYTDYYTLLKTFGMSQEALLLIIKYCVEQKGNRVGSAYILTVAKNWAYEKILSEEAVLTKLQEMQAKSPELQDVFKCLGLKRTPNHSDFNMLQTWNNEFGFNQETILYVAKKLKHKAGMEKLHSKLVKYYEAMLLSVKEIEDFENSYSSMLDIAKNIVKNLGLYYDNYEPVIENYVNKWLNMGFEIEMLLNYSTNCFKNGIKTLEGMNSGLQKLHKLGIVTLPAFAQYIDQNIQENNVIQQILNGAGLVRNVNSSDREFFKTWCNQWNFSVELINYVATLAVGKMQPMSYINKILLSFKEQNIYSVEQAKQTQISQTSYPATTQNNNFTPRSYSQAELSCMFSNLDEVKI